MAMGGSPSVFAVDWRGHVTLAHCGHQEHEANNYNCWVCWLRRETHPWLLLEERESYHALNLPNPMWEPQ